MSKLQKVFLIIGIFSILVFCCSYTFAAVDMNLNNSNNQNNTNSENNENNSSNSANTNNSTNSPTSNSSQFSTTVTTSSFDLQLTNILSICLIVVGVLLILLGIAILIRLKS